MRLAVVGHVEWVEFARVEHAPAPGEIVHALETWEEPAGGGAVAAVQLANLGGSCLLFTALADDDLGRRSRDELEARGVTVHAGGAPGRQRRALTHVDEDGERTITVLGNKLLPSGEDGSLPWEELHRCDAVYFVSGDVAALRAARNAPVLVATARELATLRRASVQIDVLVGSGEDAAERFETGELEPEPSIVVTTAGALGGWIRPGGPFRAAPLPGPVSDAYGCGDCFAAGLTYGLALGKPVDEAVSLGARCGAAVLTGRGAYEHQLAADEMEPGPKPL
ncbi:MAG TPA: PfkB family carbohydrate kinase [Gaiellaceae bacterium]|nr:PfkB family carbohydrate kinase [Gaiellaceae bacterium]